MRGRGWSQLAKKWKQKSNYEIREQSREQKARTGHSCLERDGSTEWRRRIEEEQLDAIRIRDLMFSLFLLQVLSCAFCSPAHGLVATASSGITPISWQEARGRSRVKRHELSVSSYRGKDKASLKDSPFKLSLIFLPKPVLLGQPWLERD